MNVLAAIAPGVVVSVIMAPILLLPMPDDVVILEPEDTVEPLVAVLVRQPEVALVPVIKLPATYTKCAEVLSSFGPPIEMPLPQTADVWEQLNPTIPTTMTLSTLNEPVL